MVRVTKMRKRINKSSRLHNSRKIKNSKRVKKSRKNKKTRRTKRVRFSRKKHGGMDLGKELRKRRQEDVGEQEKDHGFELVDLTEEPGLTATHVLARRKVAIERAMKYWKDNGENYRTTRDFIIGRFGQSIWDNIKTRFIDFAKGEMDIGPMPLELRMKPTEYHTVGEYFHGNESPESEESEV